MDADKREEKEKAEGVSNGEKQPFFFFFWPRVQKPAGRKWSPVRSLQITLCAVSGRCGVTVLL